MNGDRYTIEGMVLFDSKRPIGIIIADEVDKEILTEMAFKANRAEKLEAAARAVSESYGEHDSFCANKCKECKAMSELDALLEPQPTEGI